MWATVEKRYVHLCRRPLVASLPAFFAGLLFPDNALFLSLAGISIVFGRRWLALSAFLFAVGFVRATLTDEPADPLAVGEYTVRGVVTATPILGPTSQRFVLQSDGRKILVYARSDRLLMAGDLLEVTGRLERIVHYSYQGPFNQASYWQRRGVNQQMTLTWEGTLEVLAPGSGTHTWGSAWRSSTWSRLRRHLPYSEAAVAMGIVAGQQNLVPKDVTRSMQRAGTLHLLATSGFNVILLAGALMIILSHLPFPRWAQIVVALLILVIYASAVGGRPPVLRATIMAALFLGAYLVKRSPDVLSALAAAAVLCLLIEPPAIFDPGFQLTFVTVLGLALFLPPALAVTDRWLRKRFDQPAVSWATRWGATVLLTTLIAQLASAPLTAAYFGTVSLIAPLTNLLTAAAVPFIYLGTALAQTADIFWPPLARGLDLLITGPFAGWIERVNEVLAQPRWAALEFSPVNGGWAALIFGLGLLLSWPHHRSPTTMG